ncbi:MAG: hypothetical protein KA297_02330 [Kofleriaceae bacterium]|nr:hypothetical protein [Kofleriaceae bacterium]MBP6837205.1 hypothetical protein [Kofleriaceae bacterium]
MITLHLERRAVAPAAVVGAADWRVSTSPEPRRTGWTLHGHGGPPRPAGPIDDATLVALMAAADRVIVW